MLLASVGQGSGRIVLVSGFGFCLAGQGCVGTANSTILQIENLQIE
jgi:hypothetical protein